MAYCMLYRRDLSGILYTVWRTSASSCITVGTVAAACVTIACSCCSASALGLDAKKRTTASRTHSASEAIVGRETVADRKRCGASTSVTRCVRFSGLTRTPSAVSHITKCVCVMSN